MSQQTSPATSKQSYAAAVAQPAAVTNMPHSGVCTRAMANKMTLHAAAASLQAAKVPTKPRTYTASSIMAAARALIARSQGENIAAIKTPSSNTKVDVHVAKIPSPNMKVATPKMIETPRPDCTTSVLTVSSMTLEEQMQEMRKMLEQVLKGNEEESKKLHELQEEVNKLHGKEKMKKDTMSIPIADDDANKIAPADIINNKSGVHNEKQLQLLIAKTVKSQMGESSSSGLRYNKSYTKTIDSLCMPQGYQPPTFQQFDGRGNSRQHVAHFVETCNNAGTEGDLLVKQFVRSLKGIAFNWYTDLEAESIGSWGQMEDVFFSRFYSTRRIVSMSELTNAKQREEEPVVDYINRWRALYLKCKDRISETSAVEMCIDGMNWELLYILKGNKPRNFQELATRAHNMEITVLEYKHTYSSKAFRRMEHEEIDKATRSFPEDAMVISTNNASQKEVAAIDFERTRPILKELQAKKYSFHDSDLSGILDDLLKKRVIKLSEVKHPDERVKEGRIGLDDDDTLETNHIAITTFNNPFQEPHEGWGQMSQFGNPPQVEVWVREPPNSLKSKIHELHDAPQNNQEADNAEGWIMKVRKKPRKQRRLQPQTIPHRRELWGNKKTKNHKEKKKPKKDVRSQVLPIDLLEQIPPAPITLGDFFPEGYLNRVAVNVASGVINDINKEELDDKVPNIKCTNRPPIQWRKGQMKPRS